MGCEHNGVEVDEDGNITVHAPPATVTATAPSPTIGVSVPVPPATVRAGGTAPKISITVPLALMVRGYVHAHRRLEERLAEAPKDAWDTSISLFEVGNWLVSLAERCDLRGNVDLRALTFLRNRKHHHWAAAVYFDATTNAWRWCTPDVLPEPRRSAYPAGPTGQRAYEKHLDRKGETVYRAQLAERPITDVFRRLEPIITALAPDADLASGVSDGCVVSRVE